MCRVVNGGAPMDQDEVKEFMSHFDLDADGKLDINEFCRAMVGLTAGDVDEDGDIDTKEMDTGVKEAGTAAIIAAADHV